MSGRTERGFTLIELLVALTVASVVLIGVGASLIENAKINKRQQLLVQNQSSARTTMAFVTKQLRSAGWDPTGSGIAAVAVDPNPNDGDEWIDLFFDQNADGDASDVGEVVRIRHVGTRVEWREDPASAFTTVGINVTNDSDGDGTPERMFTPNTSIDPTRVAVRITTTSGGLDPTGEDSATYTITSAVALRNNQ